MSGLWDAASGEAIGADWLREALAPASAFGRRAREREPLLRRGDEARARAELARVAMVAHELGAERLAELHAALSALNDPSEALARASTSGMLDDVDLFEIARFLDGLASLAALTAHAAFDDVRPEPCDALRGELEIGRATAQRTFYLADAYAPELARARDERDAAQTVFDTARSRSAARVAAYAGVEFVRDGEFVLMRDRIVPPLPPQIRIVREAPTYLLCELTLDEATLAAEAERDATAARVAETEEAVRARLSRRIAADGAALERARVALGALDLLVARARFTQRYDCSVPEIVDAPELAVRRARFLPLAAALTERGRDYVPLDLELAGAGVLTGPNMGGKTAALRALGFLCACVTFGVPVPAERARLPLPDEVAWLGMARDAGAAHDGAQGAPAQPRGRRSESRTSLLSSFAEEIVDVRALFERNPARALVLIDEFAGTTSPREGRALLIALLGALRARGALALAATHFTSVAEAAHAAHYATGMLHPFPATQGPFRIDSALDRIGQSIDYRLRRDTADAAEPSGAFELAAALGLDADLLAHARALV